MKDESLDAGFWFGMYVAEQVYGFSPGPDDVRKISDAIAAIARDEPAAAAGPAEAVRGSGLSEEDRQSVVQDARRNRARARNIAARLLASGTVWAGPPR